MKQESNNMSGVTNRRNLGSAKPFLTNVWDEAGSRHQRAWRGEVRGTARPSVALEAVGKKKTRSGEVVYRHILSLSHQSADSELYKNRGGGYQWCSLWNTFERTAGDRGVAVAGEE